MGFLHLKNGIAFSDIGSRSIKFFDDAKVQNIDFITLAGNGCEGNEDGFGGNSTFSQPTGLCCERNTTTVDSGAKSVRILKVL